MTARPLLTFALVACAATVPAGTQQIPVFSTRIDAIRVDVLVTENGQPVRGLQPADFEVLDNGVPQQVDLISFEQVPLNVILALDMSASVTGERLVHLRRAGSALLDGLKAGDQAALVTFSHLVVLRRGLSTDVEQVRQALILAKSSGETALVDGSYSGMMLGESDAGRSLLIVFSDGLDTSSWLPADVVLDTARRSDVVIYGVSVGGLGKAAFLRDLSTLTGGTLFEVESTKDLSAMFLAMLEEFRQRYLVSYSPRGVPRSGWHRLDVRIKGRNVTVKARPGYLAGS